jgi:hypothetical protein
MGTVFMPFLDDSSDHYLGAGKVDTFKLGEQECEEFLEREEVPTRVDGELRWSHEVELEELR